MLQINMTYLKETKSCYVYQHGEPRGESHITLYLKKVQMDDAGIDPRKGITITVTERSNP